MIDQLRRAKELQESERALARVVELERTATPVLRRRLNDLLAKMTEVARDDDLWDQVAEASGEPAVKQVDAMTTFATEDLAVLLEAFGYHCPPPPSARRMVERTVFALRKVRDSGSERRQQVADARMDLLTFAMRVRHQVESTPLFAGPSRLREIARRVCARARDLLPVLIAVGVAGVVAEALAPGFGILFGKIAEKLVELGIQPVAALLAGLGLFWGDEAENSRLDPLTLHLTGLFTGISTLRESGTGVDDASLHASALNEALRKQAEDDPELSWALRDLDNALAGVKLAGEPPGELAVAGLREAAWRLHGAVDWAGQDRLIRGGGFWKRLKATWAGLRPRTVPPAAVAKTRLQRVREQARPTRLK